MESDIVLFYYELNLEKIKIGLNHDSEKNFISPLNFKTGRVTIHINTDLLQIDLHECYYSSVNLSFWKHTFRREIYLDESFPPLLKTSNPERPIKTTSSAIFSTGQSFGV